MQCFSLIAQRRVVVSPTSQMGGISFVIPETYPKSTKGIRVSASNPVVYLDDKVRISVSPALAKSVNPDYITDEGETLLILRASLQKSADGALTLIPELNANEFGAIALLDPGRGTFSSFRFAADQAEIVARGRRQLDFFSSEEISLGVFSGFDSVPAYRSARRWLCFGANLVHEVLHIRFNGYDISYDLTD